MNELILRIGFSIQWWYV